MNRREFIKLGAAAAIGAGVASAVEIPVLESQINTQKNETQSLQSQVQQAFITFGLTEQNEVEAMVETIIPSDSNGPGAKEAGVIFFIDHQLAGDYGNNARMFMKRRICASWADWTYHCGRNHLFWRYSLPDIFWSRLPIQYVLKGVLAHWSYCSGNIFK